MEPLILENIKRGSCYEKNIVEKWCDEEYNEWERLEQHKIEFEITKRYLDNMLQQFGN